MTPQSSPGPTLARPRPFMYIFGAIILVCVIGWYGFNAIDSLGLENQSGTAKVVAKEHRDASQTYTTDIIAGKARSVRRHSINGD